MLGVGSGNTMESSRKGASIAAIASRREAEALVQSSMNQLSPWDSSCRSI
jgi:hypothetical protein